MKKQIISFFILLSLLTLVSCTRYSSKSGSMDNVIGTYELTEYKKAEYGTADKADMISNESIKAYLIVGDEGQGYYIYNGTLSTIHIEYTYDDDGIKAIKYNDGTKACSNSKSRPGYGNETTMGFNNQTKTFSYIQSSGKLGNSTYPYLSVVYQKVSNDITLNYIQEKLNVIFDEQVDYMLKNMNSLYRLYDNYNNINNNPTIEGFNIYKYYLVDINVYSKKATVYYRLKEEVIDHKDTDVEVNFVRDNTSSQATITIQNVTYTITLTSDTKTTNYPVKYYIENDETIATRTLQKVYIESRAGYTTDLREENINAYITEILNGQAG